MAKITGVNKIKQGHFFDRISGKLQKKIPVGRYRGRKCQEISRKEGSLLKNNSSDLISGSEGLGSDDQGIKGKSISKVDESYLVGNNKLGESVSAPVTKFSQKIIESILKAQIKGFLLDYREGLFTATESPTGVNDNQKTHYSELRKIEVDIEEKLGLYYKYVVDDLLQSSEDILNDTNFDIIGNINKVVFYYIWNLSGDDINKSRLRKGLDALTESKAKVLFDIHVGNIARKIAYMRVKQENTGKPSV